MKNEFFEQVRKEIEGIMKGYRVRLNCINKPGDIKLHAISITKESNGTSPTIYIDEYFNSHILLKKSIYEIALEVIETWKEANSTKPIYSDDRLFDHTKIYFTVLNKYLSMEYLKDFVTYEIENTNFVLLPYIRFNDLKEEHIASAKITKVLLKHLKLSKQEIYAFALANSRRDLKPVVKSIVSIADEIVDNVIAQNKIPSEPTMTVITNRYKIDGSAVIFYSDILKQIADTWNYDLIILPSSVHSIIVVPNYKDGMTSLELKNMIMDINKNQVPIDERLDNIPYIYKRNKDCIEMY